MIQSRSRSVAVFYGWYIVAAALLILIMSQGLQNSFGVFLKPLSKDFGWSRSLTAGALLLYLICRGISGIVMGRLIDRYGPRLMVGVGAVLMGSGMLMSSMISNAWQFYIFYGLLVGSGMGAGVVPLSTTISRWFIARRGLALGIMGAGGGLANMTMPLLASRLIHSVSISGAYLVMGATAMVIIGVSALVLRKEPSEVGLRPYGEKAESGSSPRSQDAGGTRRGGEGWQFSQALRSGTFWSLVVVAFMIGAGVFTFATNIVAHATDLGVPEAMAPYLMSIMGGGQVAGMLVTGVAAERIGIRRTLILCLGIQGVALFCLTGVSSFALLGVISGIFGFGVGGVVNQLLSITAEIFGTKSLGVILGVVWMAELVGGGFGSEMGNLIYDLTQDHSYDPAFWLGGSLLIAAMVPSITMVRQRIRPGEV